MDPAARSNATSHRRYAHLGLAAVVCAAAILYEFPPDRYGFYPRCPIYAVTGWLCPGCGATRALAALLHGRVAEAIHWNALIVLLLPVIAAWSINAYRKAVSGAGVAWPQMPNSAIAGLIMVALIFMVARNLV